MFIYTLPLISIGCRYNGDECDSVDAAKGIKKCHEIHKQCVFQVIIPIHAPYINGWSNVINPGLH